MARGTIRYWAAARAAAGTPEEPYDGLTLGDVLDQAAARRGPEFARVLSRSSLLVDGLRARRETRLDDAAVIEVLPPFAGG